MADDELAALRAQRMQEMQQAGGNQGPSEEELKQQQMAKESMLARILDQQARERLQSIRTVKPEHAALVEANLLRMAQSGQIRGKISEGEFKQFLAQVHQQTAKKTKIKFARREMDDDDDDLEFQRPGDDSSDDDD
eukprot:TRINITY_DN12296_c0_g1_i1.p1 TRINITY_DN12296_c0_g1~~TRINITY_DN12296_c0_g1_i1.p1  ORF type:complete len:145 (+),score=35.01 TRINITY_DN12296_c0_g1_i1:30-437(+)